MASRLPSKIELAYLKDRLIYNPKTGAFIWRYGASNGAIKAGSPAGTIDSKGYHVIRAGAKTYKAHRIAWFFVYDKWPVKYIDHTDMNPLNNKIKNLRLATKSQNEQNRRMPNATNVSGYLGVSKIDDNVYVASIKLNRVNYYLGRFSSPILAHKAYLKKKREIHAYNTL